ncbi:VOC family protein [Sphingomonas sp.]|jgi:methylmalonyl-CoA/ethylmalonyl-CoA epimerase|uniref:VOC family protein n=1 Tax=Sphingomonas sp. TaxID=28214 RepID=UPI00333E6868
MKPGPLKALGDVIQFAYFPTDFDATMRYWIETIGVGPFFVLNDVRLDDMKYKGQPTDAVFTMALGYWGDIQIELIKTDSDAPSLYAGDYAVRDRLHHICIFVEDMKATRTACAQAGAEVIVEGKVGADGEVIYVDPGQGPGHIIEFLQPVSGSQALFQMMKEAARNWDGTDPIRVLQ